MPTSRYGRCCSENPFVSLLYLYPTSGVSTSVGVKFQRECAEGGLYDSFWTDLRRAKARAVGSPPRSAGTALQWSHNYYTVICLNSSKANENLVTYHSSVALIGRKFSTRMQQFWFTERSGEFCLK